tara:strand:- start:30 stop:353 length:324 start_codon:yes stop_codon:yes gene_type:complete
MKKIKINADSTYKYLQVFNGILELTDKELTILSKFIDLGNKSKNLCSASSKKSIAKDMQIKDPNTLNNYVKRLKDKGAIKRTNEGYKLAGFLSAEKHVVIEIFRQQN